jgi:uncharacterized membrane protein YqaE (UPF0057 family)|tara:strand:+ start:7152 stop:7382 length:231 start_codon:yes stop_codon:yes gene_type:complete
MIRRLAAILLAFVLPPAAIFLVRGYGTAFLIGLLLSVAAVVVFVFFFAGPGVALWFAAICHALSVAVFMKRKVTEA